MNFLLAAIIFCDNFSMGDFLPGSASMAWTIFRSAFHLSHVFGIGIVYIVLFGDSVQTIDTRITACESFFEKCSRTQVLISFTF